MLRYRNIVCLLLISIALPLTAQQNIVPQHPDSIKINIDSTVVLQTDSIKNEAENIILPKSSDSVLNVLPPKILTVEKKSFKPDPKKAILYSAIFPGLGQIYNRKYWKLPILYGGFIGFTYAITWNNSHYQDYFEGQKAILDDNPDNDHVWHRLLPYSMNPATADTKWFAGVLKDKKNYFRYYRDLSIILTVAWYGLGIIDAYVDAQLFEFDVSPNLSMRVEPVILKKTDSDYLANSYGFRCSFSF
ncbi:MAG: DUF5683 domain-containing protein [Bacteroidia bacterium]|nr:DUF5683 domain-containing protein [Bacteroidia bacterium]